MAIMMTAVLAAATTIIFTSHALPDHRVNLYPFIKTYKGQLSAIYFRPGVLVVVGDSW